MLIVPTHIIGGGSNMEKKPKKRVTIPFEEEVYKKLAISAEKEERSVPNFIMHMVKQQLNKMEECGE